MVIQYTLRAGGCSSTQSGCADKFGCPAGRCPDITIKRYDTKPPFKVSIEDCDGPVDFRGMVVEANMWCLARLKNDLLATATSFSLCGDIGFEQIMVGDIIVMERVRVPERMLVTGFDEDNKLVLVQRGYQGTTPRLWKRGTTLRSFRILNGVAEAEMVFTDELNVDGTTDKNVLTVSYLVYEWQPEDTCLPGCYWFEFKVLKMIDAVFFLPGGFWVGPVNKTDDGHFWTGSIKTDGAVRLSYDQAAGKYLLPDAVWGGDDTHLYMDGSNYTGLVHDDGSVFLNKSGVASPDSVGYNEYGQATVIPSVIPSYTDDPGTSLAQHEWLRPSSVPSFTDSVLTPAYFGCIMSEGVESVRRYPTSGEGFLVKIENTFTPG